VAIDVGEARAARPAVPDDGSFESFYDAHFRVVSGYALSLTGDVASAQDVAQEAMTRVYLRWGRLRDPRTWLFHVATNLTRDHWRRTTRDRGLLGALRPLTADDAPAHDPWLRDLVERLPVRLREPVLLHYYADLPVEEVARLLHRPVGSVKQRLHQARRELLDAAGGQR
jgi:RNA polymerase sigma-70 factor, ECF subfamily